MESKVADNIVHKLNQILISVSGKDELKIRSKTSKVTTSHVEFFLMFPSECRDAMAEILGVSQKTLHRIYENPIKILDDYNLILKLCNFLHTTYPEIILDFFREEHQGLPLDPNTSEFIKEIILIDQELSVETRRELSRLLVILRKGNISFLEFSIICRKMIFKKCFTSENINRTRLMIENF